MDCSMSWIRRQDGVCPVSGLHLLIMLVLSDSTRAVPLRGIPSFRVQSQYGCEFPRSSFCCCVLQRKSVWIPQRVSYPFSRAGAGESKAKWIIPQHCPGTCLQLALPSVYTIFIANFLYLLLWGPRLYREQPSKGGGDDLCPVHGLAKPVLTPTSSQLLSVQGSVGARARLWARPQSEAHWPAEPH